MPLALQLTDIPASSNLANNFMRRFAVARRLRVPGADAVNMTPTLTSFEPHF
jgi:hypothetical protein